MTSIRKIGLGLALMSAVGFLWALIDQRGLFSEEAAAWIQAAASVAAILAAGHYAAAPQRHADALERRRRIDLVNAIYDAGAIVNLHFQPIVTAVEQRDAAEIAPRLRRRSRAELSALKRLLKEPVTNWPSPQLYIHASRLHIAADVMMHLDANVTASLQVTPTATWNHLARATTRFQDAWRKFEIAVGETRH